MSRQHLSPEGLKPCDATVRACRYGATHLLENGSFNSEATVQGMEKITDHLAKLAAASGDKEDFDTYFAARSSLEQEKAGTMLVGRSFIKEITNSGVILTGAVRSEESAATVEELLVARVRESKDLSAASEFTNLLQHRDKDELTIRLIKEIQSPHLLAEVQRSVMNMSHWDNIPGSVHESLFESPGATVSSRHDLIASNQLPYAVRANMADQTPKGWVTLLAQGDWEYEGNREYAAAQKRAEAQIFAEPDNSISYDSMEAYFVSRNHLDAGAPLDGIIKKVRFTPGVDRGGNVDYFVSEALNDGALSWDSKKKALDIARHTGWGNPYEFVDGVNEAWHPERKEKPLTLQEFAVYGVLERQAAEQELAAAKKEFATAGKLGGADYSRSSHRIKMARRKFDATRFNELLEEYEQVNGEANKFFNRNRDADKKKASKFRDRIADASTANLWDSAEQLLRRADDGLPLARQVR